jgi:SAM-dependent methyltransferase
MTNHWDPEFYKTGYEGFEHPENFPTAEALQDYRKLLLQKTEAQVAFIARHLGKRKLRVIEFCSGNGRLLVALALEGILDWGLGVEISQSRVAFAEQWGADLGLSGMIRHVAADALEFDGFEPGTFDLAVCITGAFAYFKPIRESAPIELLNNLRRAIIPRGHLLLELYPMPQERKQMFALNNGKLRTWQPLPPEDRFAYYLDDFEYWEDQRILRHGKIFIGRNGMIDAGRVEVLAYYTHAELLNLLSQNGFAGQVYAGFDDTPYCEGRSSSLIALATRTDQIRDAA